jgi:hypothetical protein
MNSNQRDELSRLLSGWVETHPFREFVALAFAGRTYTPEEILDEVGNQTEFGESLGNFLYESGVSVEEMIRRAIDANKEGG